MQLMNLTGKNLKAAENNGRSEEARKGRGGEIQEKERRIDQPKRLKVEDLYTSGMEDVRLGWLEHSGDERREMKRRRETTQEASSTSLGCLALTSASSL